MSVASISPRESNEHSTFATRRSAARSVRSAAAMVAITIASVYGAIGTVQAAQTAGGVSWVDPLGYTKPAFHPIAVPDETTTVNKYYVDMSSGSGTSSCQTSAGISTTTGPPRPLRRRLNARLMIAGTSRPERIGSTDFVKERRLTLELK